jgi:hypothetical protein
MMRRTRSRRRFISIWWTRLVVWIIHKTMKSGYSVRSADYLSISVPSSSISSLVLDLSFHWSCSPSAIVINYAIHCFGGHATPKCRLHQILAPSHLLISFRLRSCHILYSRVYLLHSISSKLHNRLYVWIFSESSAHGTPAFLQIPFKQYMFSIIVHGAPILDIPRHHPARAP